jgi:hypothetical protein
MRRLVYAVAFLLACSNAASADVRIEASTGGNALSYLALFESLREPGQRIVVDGPCLSACTLLLMSIPRSRICVTRRAIFGFHAAKVLDRCGIQYPAEAHETTCAVAASYPAPIRDWIRRHGGLIPQQAHDLLAPGLWFVHRGLRYARPEGGQGVAQRTNRLNLSNVRRIPKVVQSCRPISVAERLILK